MQIMKIIKMIPVIMSVLGSLYFYVNNVSTFYLLIVFLVLVKKEPSDHIQFNSNLI